MIAGFVTLETVKENVNYESKDIEALAKQLERDYIQIANRINTLIANQLLIEQIVDAL